MGAKRCAGFGVALEKQLCRYRVRPSHSVAGAFMRDVAEPPAKRHNATRKVMTTPLASPWMQRVDRFLGSIAAGGVKPRAKRQLGDRLRQEPNDD